MTCWCSTMGAGSPKGRQTRCAAIQRCWRPIWVRPKMLEVSNLSAGYGSTHVLHDVSLHVAAGQSVCLIGANGAGKTTLMRCIAGLLRPNAGRIALANRDIGAAPTSARLGLGVALVPEGRRGFAPMRVRGNLQMGAFRRLWPRRAPGVAADMAMVFELFPRLGERQKQAAGLLSGGEHPMRAIGRPLLSRPHLLLLDSPVLCTAYLYLHAFLAT